MQRGRPRGHAGPRRLADATRSRRHGRTSKSSGSPSTSSAAPTRQQPSRRWHGIPRPPRRSCALRSTVTAEIGEQAASSTQAGFLAHAVYDQGRLDEAAALATRCQETAPADDVMSQWLWRSALAKNRSTPGRRCEGASTGRRRAGAGGGNRLPQSSTPTARRPRRGARAGRSSSGSRRCVRPGRRPVPAQGERRRAGPDARRRAASGSRTALVAHERLVAQAVGPGVLARASPCASARTPRTSPRTSAPASRPRTRAGASRRGRGTSGHG